MRNTDINETRNAAQYMERLAAFHRDGGLSIYNLEAMIYVPDADAAQAEIETLRMVFEKVSVRWLPDKFGTEWLAVTVATDDRDSLLSLSIFFSHEIKDYHKATFYGIDWNYVEDNTTEHTEVPF